MNIEFVRELCGCFSISFGKRQITEDLVSIQWDINNLQSNN